MSVIQIQLFPMVQRYKFESKSQRPTSYRLSLHGCFQWFKDTNLKVNHNNTRANENHVNVVSNGSKIQI